MSAADGVAVVFVLGVTFYVWFGFADFGAGFWDLTAGGQHGGARRRALIDAAVGPVWEANHVWLILLLIMCWTAFGEAFSSIMTTLFIPLALAALGIVLRASNFVFRKEAVKARRRHLTGWLFGAGSLMTPFFLGTVLGAVLTARVPPGNDAGNEITSWCNVTAFVIGALTVAIGSYLSATYLVAEAHRRSEADLVAQYRTRAVVSGITALGLGLAALIALRVDEQQMFDRFVDRSVLLLVASAIVLAVVLVRTARGSMRGARELAAVSVGLVVAAWGVAQYPYLLPFDLDIDQGAATATTCKWVLVWFAIAVVMVVPAIVLLFVLDQRDDLVEETDRELGLDELDPANRLRSVREANETV